MKKLFTILLISFLAIGLSAHGRGKKGMDEWHKEHFKKMDTNGDGKISKEEWTAFHDEKFTKLDKDGDGQISEEDMKEFRKEKKENRKNKK